jgi:hypothetical protein
MSTYFNFGILYGLVALAVSNPKYLEGKTDPQRVLSGFIALLISAVIWPLSLFKLVMSGLSGIEPTDLVDFYHFINSGSIEINNLSDLRAASAAFHALKNIAKTHEMDNSDLPLWDK